MDGIPENNTYGEKLIETSSFQGFHINSHYDALFT